MWLESFETWNSKEMVGKHWIWLVFGLNQKNWDFRFHMLRLEIWDDFKWLDAILDGFDAPLMVQKCWRKIGSLG